MAHLQPLSGAKLVLATMGLALVTFMTVLDTTIANVAVHTISGNLGASSSQGTWVITFFGVANAVSIPLTGWLAKRLGEVKLFLTATVLFIATSWLCGMSASLGMLIFFRIIQGAVAGPLIPLSQSLLLACYPPKMRGMALAMWSMTIIVAPICGPIIGGWICDNHHWSWIFFINVPMGMLLFALLLKILKGRETETMRRPIDKVGLTLLVLAVGCFQLMLDEGKDNDWFNSNYILALGIIAFVSFVFLIVWELGEENPIVDIRLFGRRNFAVGCLSVSLGFMLYFSAVVLLPLLLQTHMGYTAYRAGLAAAPIGFFSLLLAPVLGKNAHRLDMRVIVTISFLVFSMCFFWRTRFSPDMDFRFVVWPQFIQGIAVAFFFMPLTSILLSGLKPDQVAGASSLSSCVRVLCGSIGTSLTTTLWERREILHHARLTERITEFDAGTAETFARLADLGFSRDMSLEYIAKEITRQGYILGSGELFWLGGVLFLLLIILVWQARPPFGPSGVSDRKK